ncbi:MAG: glycosyltransferase family 1 protein [Geodermatophilaceae bacterium]|nr:glycosyltransferase family 1 protein [Geodermatophilaceae bacterium]
MRVAIVSESFLPQVNGVTNSVLKTIEHLEERGHSAMIIAPGPGPTVQGRVQVLRSPSIPLPGYADFRLSRPWQRLRGALADFQPDIVHLASPAVLGAQAAYVASDLGIPVVAVYQTDLAGFAVRYGCSALQRPLWNWIRRVHGLAERTLAPSRDAVEQLVRHGIGGVHRWARGVDLTRFDPHRRSAALRSELAPNGELLIGYVGRLAAEKQVDLLASLGDLPDVQVVIVGDGPRRAALQRKLPAAHFLGFQHGAELAASFASLDVFVHPGSNETFCQAAQEALASGVPVVAASAGGLLDLVTPGENGLLFTPGSAGHLRGAVSDLIADPRQRHAMGLEARRSVQGRSWSVIGDQLIEHYQRAGAA